MNPIRVFLIDDQRLFLESLSIVIETSSEPIEVVGTATTAQEGIEALSVTDVDVVLLDVRMPDRNGVTLLNEIHQIDPKNRVVMLTSFDDEEYVGEALRHGAYGYLLKDMAPDELMTALRSVVSGTAQIAGSIVARMSEDMQQDRGLDTQHLTCEQIRAALSPKELEVLILIAAGHDNYDIVELSNMAHQTVKNYVSRIYHKLDVHSRVKIAAIGAQCFPLEVDRLRTRGSRM